MVAGHQSQLATGSEQCGGTGLHGPGLFVDDLRATGLYGFRSADAALTAYLDADPLPDRLRKLDDRIGRELVYGSTDQRVDPDSLAQLESVMGAVTRIDGVGHTPQWELPAAVLNVLVGGGVDPVLPTAPSVRPPISPQRWTPPPAPKRARQSLETAGTVQRIELPGRGPEHVVADSCGRIVTGMQDGRLLRITLAADRHALTADRIETIADTGGRPPGMTWADADTLLVCDSERGLLQVNVPTGTISVLADRAAGTQLNFVSNVVRMPSGVVYFSCSTQRFDFAHHLADLMEHSGTGSLMRITPNGAVEVIAEALHFANGIRVAADESYVDVVETGTFAVTRVHLTGTRAGEKTQLAGNLPGYPDNMHDDGDITWLALASPRNRLLDAVLPLPGIIRKAAWAGPDALRPVHRTVWVVGLDCDGRVVHDLQTGVADFAMVTSACPVGPHLVLGSITETALGVIDRPNYTPSPGA